MKKQEWIILSSLVLVVTTGAFLIWRKPKIKRKNKPSSPSNNSPSTPSSNTSIVTEPNWEAPFDMNYAQDVAQWLAPQRIRKLSPDKALALAKKIKAAKGSWYSDDDEKAVYNVFAKQLKDKVQVANLSQAFWHLYKTDLWEYLNGFLSKKEMEKNVHEPIRKLAAYALS